MVASMQTEGKTLNLSTEPPGAVDVQIVAVPRPDTLRDTVESIVVAFIMAFVFRAFVVEAFIIPTGSMAPSLYGQHGQHRCPMCQYPFAYGIREAVPNTPQQATLSSIFSVRCPNCTWDGEGNRNLNLGLDRVVPNSGDRILVLKWPYDIGGDLLGPQRWDVVVFKDPQDGETNFIKRLIGLPGEVLEIINGDIYTAPVDSVPEDVIAALSQPPPESPTERRLSESQSERLAKLLNIQRKTTIAQSQLWMIHYDHDYGPRDLRVRSGGYYEPPFWEGTTETDKKAWDASSPVVRYQPPDDQPHWLWLKGKPIQDDYGYNGVNYGKAQHDRSCDVGDVRLKFVLVPGAGQGEICFLLSKGRDRFRATLRSDGVVVLERAGRSSVWASLREAQRSPLEIGKAMDIEMENVDYRVALRIDGEEVVWTDDDQYQPNMETLLHSPYQDGRGLRAQVGVGCRGIGAELHHLQVHRDVFYRSDFPLGSPLRNEDRSFRDYPGWATANNPILLRDDPPDFFCCGDNSPQSKDGRLWVDVSPMLRNRKDYQYGTVPGDQLIGRAFFVYWPSGLRFSKETLAIIPNVGRMRMIR
jgi:signal peptidase I